MFALYNLQGNLQLLCIHETMNERKIESFLSEYCVEIIAAFAMELAKKLCLLWRDKCLVLFFATTLTRFWLLCMKYIIRRTIAVMGLGVEIL